MEGYIYIYPSTTSSDFNILSWSYLQRVRLTQQLQFLWWVNNNTIITAAGWLRGWLNTPRGEFAQWNMPSPLPWTWMSGRLARPRSLLHWNIERFPLAGWSSWDESRCVEFMNHSIRDKRRQPCPSLVQRQHFPGGCGAPKVTFPAQCWIFCSSSHLPDFCCPRLQGFLCLTMRILWSLWQGQGWAACRQLSLHAGLTPPGINMALQPAPISHTLTNTLCAGVQCAPGGLNQLDGTQKIPERTQCYKWGSTTWSLSRFFVSFSLPLSEVSPKTLNCPGGWGITKCLGFCGCCF